MKNSQDTVFSPEFLRIFFANILLTSGFYMVMPLLPVYAVQDLSIDKSKIGLIVGVFAVSSVVARPIAGFLLDSRKRMLVYLPSVVFFAFCFGLYIVAWTFTLLILVRLVHGLSWGVLSTATSTVVSDIVPQKLRGQGLGYFGLSMTIAMAIGPALGTFLMDYISFSGIFTVCLILALLALVVSFSVKPPQVKINKSPISFRAIFEKRVFGISLMHFLFGVSYSGVMAYPILHGIEIGAEFGVKFFFPILALFVTVFRPFAGKLVDRYGPTMIIIIGYICFGVGNILLGLSSCGDLFLFSAVIIGMGAGFVMPTLMTMTVNVVLPSRRGVANATSLTAFDLGIGLGAIVLGVLSKMQGYSTMYIISASVLTIPLLWYLLYEKNRYIKMMNEVRNI